MENIILKVKCIDNKFYILFTNKNYVIFTISSYYNIGESIDYFQIDNTPYRNKISSYIVNNTKLYNHIKKQHKELEAVLNRNFIGKNSKFITISKSKPKDET